MSKNASLSKASIIRTETIVMFSSHFCGELPVYFVEYFYANVAQKVELNHELRIHHGVDAVVIAIAEKGNKCRERKLDSTKKLFVPQSTTEIRKPWIPEKSWNPPTIHHLELVVQLKVESLR